MKKKLKTKEEDSAQEQEFDFAGQIITTRKSWITD